MALSYVFMVMNCRFLANGISSSMNLVIVAAAIIF